MRLARARARMFGDLHKMQASVSTYGSKKLPAEAGSRVLIYYSLFSVTAFSISATCTTNDIPPIAPESKVYATDTSTHKPSSLVTSCPDVIRLLFKFDL